MEQKKLIKLVKKMREEMGLGVMDIKSAVEEANGDEMKAKEILKKKGYQKAKKKAGREVKAGLVTTYTHVNGKIGVMVELLCETDFVAKNEHFVRVARDICLQVTAMGKKDLVNQEFIKDSTKKIDDLIKELVAKFGENIRIGKVERFEI